LFLEAFLSARKKLYISWQGRRSTDNQKLPPSVLVSQLRDTLRSRFSPESSASLQPLQAFSEKYFQPKSEFLTYADDWERTQQPSIGSLGSLGSMASMTSFFNADSAAQAQPRISEWPLKECMRLLNQPVEVYWRSRLGVQLKGPEEALLDDENFALDGLDRYGVGRSLLQADNIELQLEAVKLLGHLPMGAAGQIVLQQQYDAAQKVRERASPYWTQYPCELPTQSIALVLAMPWGDARVSAEIAGLRQAVNHAGAPAQVPNDMPTLPTLPTLQITTRPGAVATGQKDQQTARADVLIKLWPQHLLLCAAGWQVQSVAVGLDGVAVLPAMAQANAKQVLIQCLEVYVQAWAQPLPVTFKAGLAFAAEQISIKKSGNDFAQDKITEMALDKARKEFSDEFSDNTDFARSLYVQRSFDHFDGLIQGLPIWAPLLYADLIHVASMQGGEA
jgi:exodeoxyribonuclease V gamma subunit